MKLKVAEEAQDWDRNWDRRHNFEDAAAVYADRIKPSERGAWRNNRAPRPPLASDNPTPRKSEEGAHEPAADASPQDWNRPTMHQFPNEEDNRAEPAHSRRVMPH